MKMKEQCPECGKAVRDTGSEIFCPYCGLVLREKLI